jgi:hypothetical protein
MNLTAAALRLMAEKGLTLTDVAEIVAANETKADPTAAERQRRCRANKKADASHRDVTRDPPIDNNHTPSNSPSEAKASLAPKGKATRLPADWQPDPLTGETEAMVSAWSVGMLERELSKFRDYWAGASGRRASKHDWNAAFRNWLRNANEWAPKNGTANRTSSGDRRSSLARAIDEGIEFLG